MIKYVPELTDIVLEEIPDKVTLAIEISNCQGSCIGCHSPFLKTDIGEELTADIVDSLVSRNFGINCILLLGEGRDRDALTALAGQMRTRHPSLELALYSGRRKVEPELFELFDYVKVGPYMAEYGPLNSRTTNQRLYHHGEDITSRFWTKGSDSAGSGE
ncbi:MAG: anaerobic ribonucleoside-triphosphate reductase activating protein [Bacteroidales bacterium]|nr:anaerobic ribonucleoside-triphosphate reductase activating protein [Bacteroidales bacterium]